MALNDLPLDLHRPLRIDNLFGWEFHPETPDLDEDHV